MTDQHKCLARQAIFDIGTKTQINERLLQDYFRCKPEPVESSKISEKPEIGIKEVSLSRQDPNRWPAQFEVAIHNV